MSKDGLISRRALLCEFYRFAKLGTKAPSKITISKAISTIEIAPTVDAEPVRHGRWVFKVNHYIDDDGDAVVYTIAKCSHCGKEYRENRTIYYSRLERPDKFRESWINSDEKNRQLYKEWCEATEKLKSEVVIKSKSMKLLPYCSWCGCKMGAEEGAEKDG